MSDSMEAPGEAVPAEEGGPAVPAAHGVPALEPYDPAAPAPLGVERIPTGNTEVDAHLGRLADADLLPADGHLEVYEDVHRGLRDTLTALDAHPPGPRPAVSHNPHHQHNHRS
ncbi:hypothetical protein ABZ532_29180 [Streptomyces sp. NPDC019396]|uniref:hypothetical protein n=1 Tax=Streptomyces sp. NPDC019396 TaxID=3154687 RepID=UPI0033FE25CF